jgi:hypothetical protein
MVKGFWIENQMEVSAPFVMALAHGFKHFMQFVGAEHLDGTVLSPDPLREQVEQLLHAM